LFNRKKITYSGFSDYSNIKKGVYIAIIFVLIAFIWTGYFLIKYYSSSNDINLTGSILYKLKPLPNVTASVNSESVVTDENGVFVVPHLSFGRNTIRFEKAGYMPREEKVFLWRKNQKMDDIILARDERYNFSFSGVILNNFDKKPIRDAIVNLGSSTTTTDLNGQFGFTEMPSVATKITISAVGFIDFEEEIALGGGSSNNKEYLLTPYGRVSFTSQRDGKKNIYTINYDGKNLKNLTSKIKGDCWGGQITPDGSKLVFYSNFEGQIDIWGQTIPALYVLERGSDKPKRISRGIIPDGDIKISKNRQMVIFSGSAKDQEGTELYMAGLGKGNEWIQLTNNDLAESNVDISPDGKWVVYGSFFEGERVIFTQKIGSYDNQAISSSSNRETYISYSPDGRNLLYVRETLDFSSRMYIYNIESGKEKEIYKTSANIKNLVWNKSGDRIIFTSTRDNKDNIYSIDTNGQNEIKLTNQGADYENIIWPDLEKVLAFIIRTDNGNSLAVMDISRREIKEIEQVSDDVLSWDEEVFDKTPIEGL
jgi:Tol biopolymer transport system component